MAKTSKVSKPLKKAVKKVAKREAVIPDDARIVVVAKQNPRREGSMAFRVFAAYLKARTVGEWREACRSRGLDVGYLHYDLRRGHIRVERAPVKKNGNGGSRS